MIKRFLVSVVLVILIFLGITYVALEGGGVVTVETQTGAGDLRTTHIWHVVHEGTLLLEAGHPANPWVQDIEHNPEVSLTGDGLEGVYTLERHGPETHAQIRGLMRAKYGWRDWWVALLFDTSESFLIEATPKSDATGPAT